MGGAAAHGLGRGPGRGADEAIGGRPWLDG